MKKPLIPLDMVRGSGDAGGHLDAVVTTFLQSGSRFSLDAFSAALRQWLAASSDADLALGNFLRVLGTTVSPSSLFNDILQYPLYGDLLFRLCGSSQYFSDVVVRDPALFPWLTSTDALLTPVTPRYLAPETARILSTFAKPEKRLNALKRLHRRELLRIGAQDLLGEADLESATLQLSVLADAVVDTALAMVRDLLGDGGSAFRDIPFCVIGLGKWGGNELNYSSDIDVLFVYGEEREDESGGTAHAYFNKVCEHLVRSLTQPTSEGTLYRVDTRLRPESGAGPLARSVGGYLTYYESRGELWERQMLLKARPAAGDLALGASFLVQLQPFVTPRSFREHPAASVARIKARIESDVGEEPNIKLMSGGIRDIEFTVQTLQLLHAGRNPALRERNTLRALDLLRDAGYLTPDESADLRRAYVLYRTVEHRLQTMHHAQTHTLPRDDHGFDVLARRSGVSGGGELRERLRGHVERVRGIFRDVLALGESVAAPDALVIADSGGSDEALTRALRSYGMRDTRLAARQVKLLTTGNTLTGTQDLDRSTRDAFRSVAPALFAEIARTPDPDLTLAGLTAIASSQRLPHVFYRQCESPPFRKFIVDICAVSPRFARGLSLDPLLLETLASDAEVLLGDPARTIPPGADAVELKNRRELRAGIRHVLGITSFDALTEELSALAGFLIESLLPKPGRKARLPLAIFALGKFGTKELSFDGDLDLLFVAGGEEGRGLEELEKAAAGLLRRLAAVTPAGKLYDVDARLRPEGKNAPLVVDAVSYDAYLATRASLWERQSLTRLRFVAGDPTVGGYVANRVASRVYDAPLPPGWGGEIAAMRRKTESRSRTRGSDVIDIKLGPGGMADIEFLAQMIQMRHGRERHELRGLKVTELLRSPSHDALPAGERDVLVGAYAMFRRIEFLMRIGLEDKSSLLPEGEKLDILGRLYDGSAGSALGTRIGGTMKRVRGIFLAVAAGIE
jgi:[glutamine synthetase] adenylyltransferase / [glutamine synthetase]-adenylyl-L-tyrosine phosphorylase